MRSGLLSLAATLLPAAALLAAADDQTPPGVVKLPIHMAKNPVSAWGLGRRQLRTGISLMNELKSPVITVHSSAGGSADLLVDTGSWHVWVDPRCGSATAQEACCASGRFFTSTPEYSDDGEHNTALTYGTGMVNMVSVTTNLTIESFTLVNQTFGVAEESYFFNRGTFGLSPYYSKDGKPDPKTHVIDNLVKQGAIQSRIFSLNLGQDNSSALIFGGVDRAKYAGTLSKQPIIPADQVEGSIFQRYWVEMDSVEFPSTPNGERVVYDGPATVILDSGSNACLLPKPMVDRIIEMIPDSKPKQVNTTLGENGIDMEYNCEGERKPEYFPKETLAGLTTTVDFYEVNCEHIDRDDPIDFHFKGTTIRVPLRDFIERDEENPNECYLLAAQLTKAGYEDRKQHILLGMPFMKNAYTVFDLDNMDIWLAPSSNCGTDIQALGKGPDAVGPIMGHCCADEETEQEKKPIDQEEKKLFDQKKENPIDQKLDEQEMIEPDFDEQNSIEQKPKSQS